MLHTYGITETEVLDWPDEQYERYLAFALERHKSTLTGGGAPHGGK